MSTRRSHSYQSQAHHEQETLAHRHHRGTRYFGAASGCGPAQAKAATSSWAIQPCRQIRRSTATWNTLPGVTPATSSTSTCPPRRTTLCRSSCGFTEAAGPLAARKTARPFPLRHQGLRRGEHQLPLQPARPLPRPDRGLQGSHPLAAGQRREVQPRCRSHRRLGRFGGRSPRRPAGHDRQA